MRCGRVECALESLVWIPRNCRCSFAGRDLDDRLIDEFSAGIDPCGENGEFHTFVYEGPMFAHAIPVENGK